MQRIHKFMSQWHQSIWSLTIIIIIKQLQIQAPKWWRRCILHTKNIFWSQWYSSSTSIINLPKYGIYPLGIDTATGKSSNRGSFKPDLAWCWGWRAWTTSCLQGASDLAALAAEPSILGSSTSAVQPNSRVSVQWQGGANMLGATRKDLETTISIYFNRGLLYGADGFESSLGLRKETFTLESESMRWGPSWTAWPFANYGLLVLLSWPLGRTSWEFCAGNRFMGWLDVAVALARDQSMLNHGALEVFSDYMRPPIRLSAIMETPCIFVFTHDSIGRVGWCQETTSNNSSHTHDLRMRCIALEHHLNIIWTSFEHHLSIIWSFRHPFDLPWPCSRCGRRWTDASTCGAFGLSPLHPWTCRLSALRSSMDGLWMDHGWILVKCGIGSHTLARIRPNYLCRVQTWSCGMSHESMQVQLRMQMNAWRCGSLLCLCRTDKRPTWDSCCLQMGLSKKKCIPKSASPHPLFIIFPLKWIGVHCTHHFQTTPTYYIVGRTRIIYATGCFHVFKLS